MRTCLLIAVISVSLCSSHAQSQVEHPPTMSATSRPTCNSTRDGHLISIVDASSPLDCDAVGGGNITATCKCEQNPLSTFTWVGVTTGAHTVDTDTDTDDQTASEVGITDAGTFYTGSDVESALQEVGPKLTDSRSPTAHASSHQNGGADEVLVTGLSGLLADAQTPLSHVHAGSDITSGSVPDTQISSSSITQHESSLESVLDLQDMQGAVIDSQVPDNVTISSTALRCARYGADGNLTAASGDCTSGDTTGSTSPGGLDQQVQINDGGVFNGDPGLVYNKTTDTLTTGQVTVDSVTLDDHGIRSLADYGLISAPGRLYIEIGSPGSGSDLWIETSGQIVTPDIKAGNIQISSSSITNPSGDITLDPNGKILADSGFVLVGETLSIVDNGTPASQAVGTLTFTKSFVKCDCADTDGCAVTLSESGAADGWQWTVVTVSANACNFADTSGLSELPAGGLSLGQWDTASGIYVTDRWVLTSTSNN